LTIVSALFLPVGPSYKEERGTVIWALLGKKGLLGFLGCLFKSKFATTTKTMTPAIQENSWQLLV